jgi:hypothetical protein
MSRQAWKALIGIGSTEMEFFIFCTAMVVVDPFLGLV